MLGQELVCTAWNRASLATRFGVAGGVVLLVFSLLAGGLIVQQIQRVVVRNTATAAAFYMESFLHPLVEGYIGDEAPSPAIRRALQEVLPATSMGDRILSYKIWRPGGLVIEASDADLIGKTFPPSDELRQAWAGQVAATFEDDAEEEDEAEHALGLPLLEIYSPIRADWTGEIIAVAEVYVADPALKADLVAARNKALLGVGGAGLALGLLLYAIVYGGSRTIEAQRRDLDRQLADLHRLSSHNQTLRQRVQEAAARAAITAEQGLRRIGADLHDGPAQYLAYASLRVDALGRAMGPPPHELVELRDALAQAMSEIRSISRGLVLPDIADMSAQQIVQLAVAGHQARYGQAVDLTLDLDGTVTMSPALQVCLFRFTQEGLNNAARHASGTGLAVVLTRGPSNLRLVVQDAGPGLAPDSAPGLGLSGLRDRVEALGGHFGLERKNGRTELWMEVEI